MKIEKVVSKRIEGKLFTKNLTKFYSNVEMSSIQRTGQICIRIIYGRHFNCVFESRIQCRLRFFHCHIIFKMIGGSVDNWRSSKAGIRLSIERIYETIIRSDGSAWSTTTTISRRRGTGRSGWRWRRKVSICRKIVFKLTFFAAIKSTLKVRGKN